MKLIDDDDRVLSGLTICVTPAEARELAESLADLAQHPDKHHHHVMDVHGKVELAVAVYTRENLAGFTPALRRLLEEEAV